MLSPGDRLALKEPALLKKMSADEIARQREHSLETQAKKLGGSKK